MTTETTTDILVLKLWKAASTGDAGTIRLLSLHGVDLEAINPDGYTAYNLAIMHNHIGAAKAILAGKEYQYIQRVSADLGRFGSIASATALRHRSV